MSGVKINQIDNDDTLAHQCAKVDEEVNKGKTLEIIAQKAGVSTRTAEQYDAIQRKGTEEQKEEVATRNSSIKKVYTQIQKAERLVFGNEIEEKEELKKVS